MMARISGKKICVTICIGVGAPLTSGIGMFIHIEGYTRIEGAAAATARNL